MEHHGTATGTLDAARRRWTEQSLRVGNNEPYGTDGGDRGNARCQKLATEQSITKLTAGGISVIPCETGSLSGGGETGGSSKGESMDWRRRSSASSSTQGRRCARDSPPNGGGDGETASTPERQAQAEYAAAAVVPPCHPDDLEKTGSSNIVRSDGS